MALTSADKRKNVMPPDENLTNRKKYRVLVAVDFSACSAHALKSSQQILGQKPDRIYVLHVVDHDFIQKCLANRLGTEPQIKKTLFLEAKQKLKQFLQSQNMAADSIKTIVCEGTPCLEINKKAIEKDIDIIVMGTHGTSGDIKSIFFGSTTEKVLRFIKRPVLCVPIAEERKA